MVNLRRRAMSEVDVKPKYSLKDGRVNMSSGKYGLVSNGNHIYQNGTVSSRAINYTDLKYGSTPMDNKPLWFTIPANSEVTLRLSFESIPVTNTSLNLRKTDNTMAITTGSIGSFGTQVIEVTETITEDTDISCFYAWFNKTTNYINEFDVELYVNDERWL